MLLSVLTGIKPNAMSYDPEIKAVIRDSRKAAPGTLFVCIKGAVSDGHDYAVKAYEKGCRVFAAERDLPLPPDCVLLRYHDTNAALAELSAAFYGHPAKKLKIIAVTGTKGKTTVSFCIDAILRRAGFRTALIGTVGAYIGNVRTPTENTTPDSLELNRLFSEAVRAGAEYCVMEVSSQAVKLDRIHGLNFEAAVFTNLSPDHISPVEHKDFEEYRACKTEVFRRARLSVINVDDENASYFLNAASGAAVTVSSVRKAEADYFYGDISRYRDNETFGVGFYLTGHGVECRMLFSAPGEYSACNAALAASLCLELKIPVNNIIQALGAVRVPGRFELIPIDNGVRVIIDYAHNEASLNSVLKSARDYIEAPGRLICVVGSVGGKAESRRPQLAYTAARNSDMVILTSDNPNFENPEIILRDMLKGIPEGYMNRAVIPDRKEAIEYALSEAAAGDVIVLAGKGHEDYQLVNGKHIPFSERDIVGKAVKTVLKY